MAKSELKQTTLEIISKSDLVSSLACLHNNFRLRHSSMWNRQHAIGYEAIYIYIVGFLSTRFLMSLMCTFHKCKTWKQTYAYRQLTQLQNIMDFKKTQDIKLLQAVCEEMV